MSWPGMVRIHGTPNSMEAHIFRTALAQYGIEARIRNEFLSTLAGAVPVTEVMIEVWVAADQATEAVAIIEEALARPTDTEEDDGDGRLSLVDDPGRGGLSMADGAAVARPSEPPRCGACGETSPTGFEVCWKCGADL